MTKEHHGAASSFSGPFSLKKAGGFRLSTGGTDSPVFSGDGRYLAALVSGQMRVLVWRLDTAEKIATLKSPGMASPAGLVISHDGSRVAVRNSGGLIDVLDVASGERIRRIKKKPLNDGYCLSMSRDGNLLFDADNSIEPGVRVWSVTSGEQLAHYPYVADFMCSAINRSADDGLLVCLMAKADYAAAGGQDQLFLLNCRNEVTVLDMGLNDATAAISPDGRCLFVAGQREKQSAVFRLLDMAGQTLLEKDMGNLRTFPQTAPAWSAEGDRIAWSNGPGEPGWILDARTLDICEEVYWPNLSLALGACGWVALAGDKGIAIPYAALKPAVACVGKPAWELKKQEFDAYVLRMKTGVS